VHHRALIHPVDAGNVDVVADQDFSFYFFKQRSYDAQKLERACFLGRSLCQSLLSVECKVNRNRCGLKGALLKLLPVSFIFFESLSASSSFPAATAASIADCSCAVLAKD
jgi:hypothetical protein